MSKLLEVYVTSAAGNESYNARYMSHYYSLLLLLAERHRHFKKRLLEHNNWRWSLRAFVLGHTGSDAGPLCEVIVAGVTRHIEEDVSFRALMLPYLAAENCDGGKRSLLTQSRLETGTLKLVIKIFECEAARLRGEEVVPVDEDNLIALFVGERHRGLSQLSTSVEKFHRQLEDFMAVAATVNSDSNGNSTSTTSNNKSTSSNSKIPPGMTPTTPKMNIILEGLSLSLECICFILNAYGMNQVRSLMSHWPEVDDMNFICTQIVTRTQEEWDNCLGQGNEMSCRVESMRAVEHASELLKILASAEAVAEAEGQ